MLRLVNTSGDNGGLAGDCGVYDGRMKSGSACGKIILSGEHAVVFGLPGVAIPVGLQTDVAWDDDNSPLHIAFESASSRGAEYVQNIVELCEKYYGPVRGEIHIHNEIPLGKGMGSSTALVIALCRTILGPNCEKEARAIEDVVNPGNSGLDFAVIWHEKPILFAKGSPTQDVDIVLPKDAMLIDTGSPNEGTSELITWVKERQTEIDAHLQTIAWCSQRLLAGDPFIAIVRDHHRAQVGLGVVPKAVQDCIAEIEEKGGAAKVLGAGAKTGGGGMVLVVGLSSQNVDSIISSRHYRILQLPPA